MNIRKKVLASCFKLYAQAVIWDENNDRPRLYLAASEAEGPCFAIDADTYETRTVWEGPGGTMTICPRGSKGDFLAVQNFFPVFSAAGAVVVHGRLIDGAYDVAPCISLPYIHRFEIADVAGENYFVGATLAESKESPQDWSRPGKVYVGKIPENPRDGFGLGVVLEGITKKSWNVQNAPRRARCRSCFRNGRTV